MIMSAIFIETFFSTCGACASADAVNASESIAMARNFPINDMFSSLSERSSWRDGYNTTVILIFHRVRWAQSIYLGNLTFVQATAVEFRYSPSTAISWPYNASGKRPRGRRAAEQRDERAPLHSITSSARNRMDVGNSIPSAFAVLRLRASSNVVACSTGRSIGLAPLRILTT